MDTPAERVSATPLDVPIVVRPAHMDDLDTMLQLQAIAFADKFRAAFGRSKTSKGVAALARTHRLQGPSSLAGMHVAESARQIVGTITMRTAEMRIDDGNAVEQAFMQELGTWGTLRALHAFSQLDHRIGRNEAYITDVAVLPELRRRGIAGLMVRYVAGLARQQGKACLSLYVSASNAHAIALYHKLGFRQQRVRRSWWNALLLGERRWVYMTCPLL